MTATMLATVIRRVETHRLGDETEKYELVLTASEGEVYRYEPNDGDPYVVVSGAAVPVLADQVTVTP